VAATVSSPGVREDWDGTGVSISQVIDRLAVQRRPPDGGMPFTMAGVLNLVAYATDPSELDEMSRVIERLADHQPSRAVLLATAPGGSGIDATVSTSCRLGVDHTGVAVEMVVLTLHGDAAGGAASATVPLLRADLPTVLWWPGPPDASGDGVLDRLAGVVDRVITESGRAPGAEGVRALASWASGASPSVTDLAWARITAWRQLIAQMVDEQAMASLRDGSPTVLVAHGGAEPDAGTLLLAGWLRDVIGDDLTVRLASRPAEDGEDGPVAVELDGGGTGRRLTIERLPGRAAAVVCVTEPDGATRRRVLPLPESDRARLLAGELEMQRRDRPFERALAGAAQVAA
jgi:glucose-6-phosphate dehydrogenase assembly protein OpcA